MTRFKEPTSEQMAPKEWLISDDDDPFVTMAVALEGDAFHVGWSVRITGDDLTLPQIEAAGEAAREAIKRALFGTLGAPE